jgi:hypothetical protein
LHRYSITSSARASKVRGTARLGVGRRLNLAHFQYGEAISSIGQDRQMAQTRDDLAQDFTALGSQIGNLTGQSSDVAAGFEVQHASDRR